MSEFLEEYKMIFMTFSWNLHFSGSSWPKDQIQVSYIGRQVLYHWATKGSPYIYYHTRFTFHQLQGAWMHTTSGDTSEHRNLAENHQEVS